MPEPLDPIDIALEIAKTSIRFVLIGGLAMQLHGSNTHTEDTDISFAMDEDNLQKLSEWINQYHPRPFGFGPEQRFLVTPEMIQRHRFLVLKTDIGPIDLLKSPTGIDSFEGLWERAKIIDAEGYEMRVASLDDLIAMKKSANRPKDQVHLMELLALKKLIEESGS